MKINKLLTIALLSSTGLMWEVKAFPIAESGTEGLKVIVSRTDPVIATYQGNSASYSNDLYLDYDSPDGPIFIFNNHDSIVGSTFNLGLFDVGTELLFRLHVNDTGNDFFTGPADRNPDGQIHARVQQNWEPNTTLVSFEDSTDFYYNDLSFTFTNTTTVNDPVFVVLNITKQGTGNGTVTSSPAGIDCGTDCSENYTSSTRVTLTATPATDSTFDGWSGDCTGTTAPPGTAATCTLTVDAAKNVTATFSTNAPNPSVPTAVTNAPTVVTGNSVRMSGTVNDNGADTTVTFEFGTSNSYGETINAEPNTISAGSGSTNVAATKDGLICNTTYHYRVKAVNNGSNITVIVYGTGSV